MRIHSPARRGHAQLVHRATLITAMAGLVAACSGSVGVAGPVPTPAADRVIAELPNASPGTSPVASVAPVSTPPPSPAPTSTVRVYLFQPDPAGGDAHLVPVIRTVTATRAVATAAIRELLGGPLPTEHGLLTMIPAGTQLLGITIDSRVATVDLSGTFESGGGSASMLGRLAQLVYTVTQFPTVDTIQLRLDGQPVESIGGEGVMVGAGLGRTDSAASLPQIFVDGPAWGGTLPSPGRVTGTADVFEAQFRLQVLDGRRNVLVDMPVHATCGTGCRGTFDVTVRYTTPAAGWGTLRVFDLSAKDGTPVDVSEYPVWLAPAG